MKREIAENYFKEGYNCAQAVALSFKEEIGLSEDVIARAVSGFGGGMGRMREVCGAVSGMLFVLSNLKGYSDPKNNQQKIELYSEVQRLMGEFKEKNVSYVCRELLNLSCAPQPPIPEKRTEEYYKKRPCVLLVGDAAEIMENYLEEKKNG